MRTSDRRATLALVFLLGLTWLPLYLKGRTPSLWFTGSLLGGHLFALGFILFARRHPHTKPPTKDLRLLALLITLSGLVVFSGINVYQWAHFHFVGQDIATIQQALWCKLHLGTFQVSFNSLPSLDGRWHNHFGVHAHYLLLALLGPFAIWPHTLTLLLTKVVALSACALPMYLLGREYLGERGGLLAVMLWLSHPVLIGQMTFELYDLQFAPLILLSILYAFQKERYTLYLLGVGLLVLLREELAFTAMMLAPYALIMKRKRAWVWGPVRAIACQTLTNQVLKSHGVTS